MMYTDYIMIAPNEHETYYVARMDALRSVSGLMSFLWLARRRYKEPVMLFIS
jgi:hypothetical protein